MVQLLMCPAQPQSAGSSLTCSLSIQPGLSAVQVQCFGAQSAAGRGSDPGFTKRGSRASQLTALGLWFLSFKRGIVLSQRWLRGDQSKRCRKDTSGRRLTLGPGLAARFLGSC